ncbi:MAG: class I SAM-dependent methyltransferase [Clostridiaceae bacterium]|nr:class I SAM-dependent methyltransferase [Clostridiaceae bacterium]
MVIKNELIQLYEKKSKHSNYQILPSNFDGIIEKNELKIVSRYETERLKYILENIDIANKSIIDIGGNTGYFTFEMINAGAMQVDYYEGNEEHSEFVKKAADFFLLRDRIKVHPFYFDFGDYKFHCDVILCLNVLHHVGDDYGNTQDIAEAKKKILNQINKMAKYTQYLVFQLGYNWKGNRNMPLFDNGTKEEMIEYVKNGTEKHWEIKEIGIAERCGDKIQYFPCIDNNIGRSDALGEFLNRPIFIMKSKNM